MLGEGDGKVRGWVGKVARISVSQIRTRADL